MDIRRSSLIVFFVLLIAGALQAAPVSVQMMMQPAKPVAGGGGGGSVKTYIQSNLARVGSDLIETVALPSDSTAGNIIFVGGSCYRAGGCGLVTPTDADNTYVLVSSRTIGAPSAVYLWRAQNVAGGPVNVSVYSDAGGTSISLAIAEYSGASTTNPIVQAANAVGSNNSPTTGNVTTTAADQMLIGVVAHIGSTIAINAGTSFTIRQEEESDSFMPIALEDRGSGGGLAAGTYPINFGLGSSASWGIVGGVIQ